MDVERGEPWHIVAACRLARMAARRLELNLQAPSWSLSSIISLHAFLLQQGLLTPEGRRVLGALSFLVFNPSLIFVKLASTLTPARLLHWWPLVINTGIRQAAGVGIGAWAGLIAADLGSCGRR